MNIIPRKLKCFNCDVAIKEKEAYTIKLDTLEGLHEMKMCEKCAKDFDDIMIQIQEILDERI